MTSSQFASYPSLKGRGVIITGGASGIGAALVEAFCAQGARVAFLDRDREEGSALVQRIAADKGTLTFWPCDVTDTPHLKSTIGEAIAALGGLGVLINNAANDTRHSTAELTPEGWDDCMAINLKQQFFATQAVIPALMAAGGGSIICLGSIAWLRGTTGMIGYTTAKAAVQGLVRTLARELGPHRIRVNALLPGWTMTERQLKLWVDAQAEQEIAKGQCLPDKLLPSDVARMALFLAADDSRMCTQQTFIVDGGWV